MADVITEWRLLCGEWVLTGFRPSIYPGGGYVRRPMYTLSPFGPPFRYRVWHRENKDWERWELPHVTNIEEAKACLQVALRLA